MHDTKVEVGWRGKTQSLSPILRALLEKRGSKLRDGKPLTKN